MAQTTTYELKMILPPFIEKEELVKELGLTFINKYEDLDKYLQSDHEFHREKLKYLDGKIKYYMIQFSDDIFTIKGEVISEERATDLLKRGVTSEKTRRKEVYDWPTQNVKVSFDYITKSGNLVFLEIYGKKKQDVLDTKEILAEHGISNTMTQTYDTLVNPDS